MKDLAIIGLDTKFADADNIDRFERLVYLGKCQEEIRLAEHDLAVLCEQSLDTLASNNGLSNADIDVILSVQKLLILQWQSWRKCLLQLLLSGICQVL